MDGPKNVQTVKQQEAHKNMFEHCWGVHFSPLIYISPKSVLLIRLKYSIGPRFCSKISSPRIFISLN